MIDTSELIRRLEERGARRVALQFPAGLKRQAFGVARDLKQAGLEPLISGDPCYGGCDLAEGLLPFADVLVHFGHTPVDVRDTVLFELLPTDIDIGVLDAALPLLRESRIGLVTTAQHVHQVPQMVEHLAEQGVTAVVAPGSSRAPHPGQVLGCHFEAARRTGAGEILYVGSGVFHPLGVQLATGARVIALDPFLREAREVDASRLRRKRFALIEKARGAGSIGVLVSLKSGQARWELARRLGDLSEKAVLVALHEVTPEELLNLGLDCYVNTACPRLAYDDQERYPVPVLTPPEFEILCGVRSWDQFRVDEICG